MIQWVLACLAVVSAPEAAVAEAAAADDAPSHVLEGLRSPDPVAVARAAYEAAEGGHTQVGPLLCERLREDSFGPILFRRGAVARRAAITALFDAVLRLGVPVEASEILSHLGSHADEVVILLITRTGNDQDALEFVLDEGWQGTLAWFAAANALARQGNQRVATRLLETLHLVISVEVRAGPPPEEQDVVGAGGRFGPTVEVPGLPPLFRHSIYPESLTGGQLLAPGPVDFYYYRHPEDQGRKGYDFESEEYGLRLLEHLAGVARSELDLQVRRSVQVNWRDDESYVRVLHRLYRATTDAHHALCDRLLQRGYLADGIPEHNVVIRVADRRSEEHRSAPLPNLAFTEKVPVLRIVDR